MIKIFGECIVSSVHDTGTGAMRARVDRADPLILVSDQVIAELRADDGAGVGPDVTLEGNVLTFGCDDLGIGRVSYELGDRYDAHSVEATRIA